MDNNTKARRHSAEYPKKDPKTKSNGLDRTVSVSDADNIIHPEEQIAKRSLSGAASCSDLSKLDTSKSAFDHTNHEVTLITLEELF